MAQGSHYPLVELIKGSETRLESITQARYLISDEGWCIGDQAEDVDGQRRALTPAERSELEQAAAEWVSS